MSRARAASMRLVPGATSISLPSMVSFGIIPGGGLRPPSGTSPQDCAGKARARTRSSPSLFGDQRLELVPELLDQSEGASAAPSETSPRIRIAPAKPALERRDTTRAHFGVSASNSSRSFAMYEMYGPPAPSETAQTVF